MTQRFRCRGCGAVYAAVQRDGTTYQHACAPIVAKDGTLSLRQGHRNEVLSMNRRGVVTGIVSEGAGVEAIDNTAGAEPAWLVKLKRELAKREEQDGD